MVTLRQLRYLEALARHRHFGRAAAAGRGARPQESGAGLVPAGGRGGHERLRRLLATIVQMVANGLGVTLLPELSLAFEVRDPRIAPVRLGSGAPSRTLGLAWRRSSPRRRDFVALGRLLAASRPAAGAALTS